MNYHSYSTPLPNYLDDRREWNPHSNLRSWPIPTARNCGLLTALVLRLSSPPPPPASISLKDSENWMFSDRLEYGDSVLVFLCGRWDSLMVRPDRGSNRCSANAKNSALVIPPSLHSLRTTFHQIALFLVIRVGAIDDFLTADKNLFAPCPTALGAETSWIAGLIRLLYLLVVASRDTVAEHCHPPLFTSGNRALVFPKNCLL